ncbi:hypothetical protein QMN58_33045, partial [Escherichia coli]|nr:hypothetical protein [Escherichia coli]
SLRERVLGFRENGREHCRRIMSVPSRFEGDGPPLHNSRPMDGAHYAREQSTCIPRGTLLTP